MGKSVIDLSAFTLSADNYEEVMAAIEDEERKLREEHEPEMEVAREVHGVEEILDWVAAEFEKDPGLYMRFY